MWNKDGESRYKEIETHHRKNKLDTSIYQELRLDTKTWYHLWTENPNLEGGRPGEGKGP
jgi:hypothetical protein